MKVQIRHAIAVPVLAGAAAMTLTVPTATASTPQPATASVTGSAQVRLTYWPDDDVRTFTFDARATPYSSPKPGAPAGLPTDAKGTVKISHWVADENVAVRMEGRVDCLVTSPGVATLTAVVTKADEPVADQIGTRLGLSVYDGRGGRDKARVGFSWSVVNADQNKAGEWGPGRAGTCMAPAPYAPVTKGGYTVRHVDLPPEPAAR
ncbi:hypothetical protein [Actinomadura alba]|uniref:Repetin n=1 Tax=Actinomadura alba TaxID=406431 RepID=A0ABR7LQ18_9ACTN|nr:hypothetical protein [Actinomadura alba]MBC6466942.1 hypothetical protein [Actinomadura alba]